MGWEKRHGGTYFYRSVRRGRSVEKTYLGNRAEARLAESLMAEGRERRRAEAGALAALEAALRPPDGQAALDRACRLAAEAALVAAGYRKDGSGHWRGNRHGRRGGDG